MTHVSSDTYTDVASSHAKKQVDQKDNQSEILFDSLFSIVSELDLESVNYLNNELSKETHLDSELENKEWHFDVANKTTGVLEDSDEAENEAKIDVNLVIATQKLRSILITENPE